MKALLLHFRWLILIGLVVGFARYAYEWTVEPKDELGEPAKFLGLWYVMPVVLLIGAFRGLFTGLNWKRSFLGVFMACFLVWAVPNSVAYTTGQLQGWNFSRFHYDYEFEKAQKAHDKGKETGVPVPTPQELLGRDTTQTRTAPRGDSTAKQIGMGVGIGLFTGLIGGVAMSLFGLLARLLGGLVRKD